MLEELAQYRAYLVPIKEIWADPDFNVRNTFLPESVTELMKSVVDNGGFPLGLKYPVIVQPWDKEPGFKYRLIAGFRRRVAIMQLGWTTIPGMVTPDDISEFEAHKINYIENLERKDLNILEEARGIQKLFPSGENVSEIMREIRRPRAWVQRRLILLQLPIEIQKHCESGRLSQADLDAILPLVHDPAQAIIVANKILDAKLQPPEEQRKVKGELFRLRKRHIRHPRRTKGEITDMIAYLFQPKYQPLGRLPTRIAAWCAGGIATEDLKRDIDKAVRGEL